MSQAPPPIPLIKSRQFEIGSDDTVVVINVASGCSYFRQTIQDLKDSLP